MPTAVKSKPEKKNKQVVFYAACPNLNVIRIPDDEELMSGNRTRKIKGLSYQFQQHFLHVWEGKDIVDDGINPETGEPVTQDAVTWLREKSKEFNSGQPEFFEEHFPPVPPSAAAIGEIVTAMAAKDEETLVRILDAETEGHKRSDVIDAATAALKSLDGEEPAEA